MRIHPENHSNYHIHSHLDIGVTLKVDILKHRKSLKLSHKNFGYRLMDTQKPIDILKEKEIESKVIENGRKKDNKKFNKCMKFLCVL